MTDTLTRRRRAPRQVRAMPLSGFKTRDTSDGITVEGYASTFDQPYDLGWWSEVVRAGAFSKTLAESPDVRFLVNHEGMPLARTRSGTLALDQDDTGLFVRAALDPADPDVAALVPKMRRGDLDQMSFAFRIVQDLWSPDGGQCDLLELALDGGDVSVVTYPANPNTSIALRSVLTQQKVNVDRIRLIHKELREGKMISAANAEILANVLTALGSIDEAFDLATAELDTATDAITSLVNGAPDDPDDDTDDGSGTSDVTDEPADPDEQTDSARSLPLALARHMAEAARLRA